MCLLLGTRPYAQVVSAQGCVPPPAGIIAWYPGDDAPEDIIGGNTGALNGSARYIPAKFASGFQMNSGFLRAADTPALRPPLAVTVSAWIKGGSPGKYGYLVNKAFDAGSGSYALYSGHTDGLFFYITLAPNDYVLSPDAGATIYDDTFHHVVGTYDGSVVRLYVDGAQVKNGTQASGAISYDSSYDHGDLFIDTFGTEVSYQNWDGAIDEVMIFERALDSAEIQSLFTADTCKNPPAQGNIHVYIPLVTR